MFTLAYCKHAFILCAGSKVYICISFILTVQMNSQLDGVKGDEWRKMVLIQYTFVRVERLMCTKKMCNVIKKTQTNN